MKKIISLLMAIALMSQAAFFVSAEEEPSTGPVPVYEVKYDHIPEGNALKEGVSVSLKGTVTVAVDENGEKYLRVDDRDANGEIGVNGSVAIKNDRGTLTFDYMAIPGTLAPARCYVGTKSGNMASVTLNSVPNHYNGKSYNNTTGNLIEGEWTTITMVFKRTEATFDMYQEGALIGENIPTRNDQMMETSINFRIFGDPAKETNFGIKNIKVYDGEVVPPMSEKMQNMMATADRELVDYTGAIERLDSALKGAVAMSIGNSMARVDNNYVNIYPGEPYVAPYISDDGSTLIPARFATEAIGCEVEVVSLTQFKIHKGGTTIEFNTGDKNAIINGQVVEMPTAPVIKRDRLFVPLRFAAETFGKHVFWDDRGLIIISDGEAVKAGQEDIIKPLLTQIRNYTTIFGNKKYSDVNMSSRQYRSDGYYDGKQWGTLDATKRFMATVDRWTYTVNGDMFKAMQDQGVLIQGTLNANIRDDDTAPPTCFTIEGTPWTRSDGANGTTWGCVNNPTYKNNILKRAGEGVDSGLFLWQFDDWPINGGSYGTACFCDYCMKRFTKWLMDGNATAEELQAAGFPEITAEFNFKTWLKDAKGITTTAQWNAIQDTPPQKLWMRYNRYASKEFHKEIKAYMEQRGGESIFYSLNKSDALSSVSRKNSNWTDHVESGWMGESSGGVMNGPSIFGAMLVSQALDIENIFSPLPKTDADKNLTYSGIAMTYATGQFMLVPWDDWLYGSTRYFATVEELEGSYEMAREYPYLLDNYEIPAQLCYVFDLDSKLNFKGYMGTLLTKGIPAKAAVRFTDETSLTFREENFKGVQAIIGSDELANVTDKEWEMINNSWVPFVPSSDTAKIAELENTYWTARTNEPNLYTVLRTNQLYDNAPVVVHAVNYDEIDKTNCEIELNNMYLPEGDELTVYVYKPGENKSVMRVRKGDGITKLKVDHINRWTIFEICGANTVRRGANFDISADYNGIGLGTRISNDKAYGTPQDFTIVTYSEGLNSTTFQDTTGTQDEAAFIYKRLDKSALKNASIKAGFETTDSTYGLMIRDGLYSNARFAGVVYDDENGLRIAERIYANKRVKYTEISKDKPAFLKLERRRNEYAVMTSDDGVNFKEVGTLTAPYDHPIGGVFAASPDGTQSICRVKDMLISDGNFPSGEEFARFTIECGTGTINDIDSQQLVIKLDTDNYKGLGVDDVNIKFTSSDENVLIVQDDGTIVPQGAGTAQITAVASMGLRNMKATTKINVMASDTTMFAENFDSSDELPEYITPGGVGGNAGKILIRDGAYTAINENDVFADANASWRFEQKSMPTVFEFDFKANYGTESPTTGARVIYAHGGSGICLTTDPGTLNWFYGSVQTKVADMEPNVWHHIKIEANYDEQWCNVYLDGVKVVDQGPVRGAISPDGQIQMGGWRLGKDSCYQWDNIRVYYVREIK